MPELPEVEIIASELNHKLQGKNLSKIIFRNASGFRLHLECFDTAKFPVRVSRIDRRGKYIVWFLDSGSQMWMHLGMTGRFEWVDSDQAWAKHEHISFLVPELKKELRFCDIRKFGIFYWIENPLKLPAALKKIAPDPFEISSADFISKLKGRRSGIKSLLLNQELVSGIGNIYASESLHRAGIRPAKQAHRLSWVQLERLHLAVQEVLKEAVANGGSSVDDYVHTDGSRGGFQNLHRVYGRSGSPCLKCGSKIKKLVITGRSTFFCSVCQK